MGLKLNDSAKKKIENKIAFFRFNFLNILLNNKLKL